MNGEDRQKS
ncbi:hypothetical protein YPPY98_1048, partial [Yersinia pestis PY-98]